jgi:hypothetical protein
MTMNPKLEEARKFLDKEDDGTKIFEVKWTQKVTWFVAAASREEVEQAAKEILVCDFEFDAPDVFVSTDRTEWVKNHREKFREQFGRELEFPVPDSGVFKGKIIEIREYFALRAWHLICDRLGDSMKCSECGHEDLVSEFNLNPDPEYGHVPKMGCPRCRGQIDWVDLVGEKQGER